MNNEYIMNILISVSVFSVLLTRYMMQISQYQGTQTTRPEDLKSTRLITYWTQMNKVTYRQQQA